MYRKESNRTTRDSSGSERVATEQQERESSGSGERRATEQQGTAQV
jgi:hypothetical protein